MQLDAMKILADDLLCRSTLPAGAGIRSWIEANPARLMLEVRLDNPPRAGIVAVSQLAAEEDGAEAVTDALAELLAHLERGDVPHCAGSDAAPLLLIRTSLGWYTEPHR